LLSCLSLPALRDSAARKLSPQLHLDLLDVRLQFHDARPLGGHAGFDLADLAFELGAGGVGVRAGTQTFEPGAPAGEVLLVAADRLAEALELLLLVGQRLPQALLPLALALLPVLL